MPEPVLAGAGQPLTIAQSKTSHGVGATDDKGEENLFVEAKKLKGNPDPSYPLAARQRGYEGRVLLRVAIQADGCVETVNVKTSSGHAMLDQTALATVQNWRFQPARRGDQAVATVLDVPVVFRLHD
jgi:periplasmic protein TonB